MNICAEYGDRVNIIVVRPDFGHKQNKSREQRYKEATEWADRIKLPCLLLLDSEEQDFRAFGTRRSKHWQQTYLLNTAGEIVYMYARDTSGNRYHGIKMALDRVLDPAFDKARRDGFPDKPKELPKKMKMSDGIAYIEDFESYKDTYDYVLQPCWGHVETNLVHTRGELDSEQGRNGSQALSVWLGKGRRGGRTEGHNIEHAFPRPLTGGHLRLYVRRGKSHYNRKKPGEVISVTLYGSNDAKIGTIKAEGDWEKESFSVDGKSSGAILSKDGWHEIKIVVQPDKPSEVLIDGKPAGSFSPGSLTKVGLNCGRHGFIIDDVELFYAK